MKRALLATFLSTAGCLSPEGAESPAAGKGDKLQAVRGARCGNAQGIARVCGEVEPPGGHVTVKNAQHRGHDMFFTEDERVIATARFAYKTWFYSETYVVKQLVDIYLLEGCTRWRYIKSVYTNDDHAESVLVEVPNKAGRVYADLGKLPIGRHRVHFVLRADGSSTDTMIEVTPREGLPIVVTDVDGTITRATAKNETRKELHNYVMNNMSELQPDADLRLKELEKKGYIPMYLTTRPEQLSQRTKEFVAHYSLPPGIVHTQQNFWGDREEPSEQYKAREIKLIGKRGLRPVLALGNKENDAKAYATEVVRREGIVPVITEDARRFLNYYPGKDGLLGHTFNAYTELTNYVESLPDLCGETE